MSEPKSCLCQSAPALVFPCSGAADVGEITDRAARKLSAEGAGKMFCLAGVGGRVSGILKSVEAAERILAIDGCPLHCAKKTLLEAGLSNFDHFGLESLGLAKGTSSVTDEAVAAAAQKAKTFLCGAQE